MLASPLTLTCYDEDRGFLGRDASHELGKATIDLSCLLTQREVALTVPLSWEGNTALAEGSISLSISWEMEEEFEPEAEAEAPMTIEEQLAWELGIESLDALGGGGGGSKKSAPAAALSRPTSLLSRKGPGRPKKEAKLTRKNSFSKKSAKKKGTQPDMLSLSISISILAKFMLFDLVGFFQVNSSPAHPPTHSLTHSLAHSLTHARTRPLTHSLAHSLTHSLTHSPTPSLTHSLTRSLTCPLARFSQVNSALVVSMPDIEFPQGFKQMSSSLTGVFNLGFLTEWGEANCSLGGDQCFRVLLIMLTLVAFQLAFPAAVGLARFLPPLRKRVSQARLETLVDRAIHGNAIIMMVLHPVISKQLVGLVDCTYYNDENVLSSYKLVRCGPDATCIATIGRALLLLPLPDIHLVRLPSPPSYIYIRCPAAPPCAPPPRSSSWSSTPSASPSTCAPPSRPTSRHRPRPDTRAARCWRGTR